MGDGNARVNRKLYHRNDVVLDRSQPASNSGRLLQGFVPETVLEQTQEEGNDGAQGAP